TPLRPPAAQAPAPAAQAAATQTLPVMMVATFGASPGIAMLFAAPSAKAKGAAHAQIEGESRRTGCGIRRHEQSLRPGVNVEGAIRSHAHVGGRRGGIGIGGPPIVNARSKQVFSRGYAEGHAGTGQNHGIELNPQGHGHAARQKYAMAD